MKKVTCPVTDSTRLSMMMLLFEHVSDNWRNFQRENLKALNIPYDPIRHESNVIFLSVFCSNILLGFETKYNDLKKAFCQEVLVQQRSEIQDYICKYGTNADITYYKAFKWMIEKKDPISMGNAICELLLKCNEKYDPYYDIPLGDMFLTFQAVSRFNNFLKSFQKVADELRRDKIEIQSDAGAETKHNKGCFSVILLLVWILFAAFAILSFQEMKG